MQTQSDYSELVRRLWRWSSFGYGVEASSTMRNAAPAITTLQAELAEARQANAASVDDHKSQSVIDNTAYVSQTIDKPRYKLGDFVQKKRGSSWRGVVVGDYSTDQTEEGYSVVSLHEPGSVQVWPLAALEDWDGVTDADKAWNEAIEAAVRVARNFSQPMFCTSPGDAIAQSIRAMKKEA